MRLVNAFVIGIALVTAATLLQPRFVAGFWPRFGLRADLDAGKGAGRSVFATVGMQAPSFCGDPVCLGRSF
jgi:hypothetical protein